VKQGVKSIFKKILFAISANLTSLLLSAILSLIVPKLLGVAEYGYWQLYLLYVMYTGFLSFGWPEGIYLRYGGKEYEEVDKELMHSQYLLMISLEVLIALFVSVYAFLCVNDSNRVLILVATGLNCILLYPRLMLKYLLQGTARIKEYATNVVLERVLFASFSLSLLFMGFRKFQYILASDILAQTFAMVHLAWICRDIMRSKGVSNAVSFREAWNNVSVGIKLVLANISGVLVIGIVQFFIERTWDIATFGKVSLSLSLSNLVLVFISAFSVVFFPIIKRSKPENLQILFDTLGKMLSFSLILFLVLFYPIKILLSLWLPDYSDSLGYFSLLFPICLFEARNSLLINTYLKALRKEKAMLWLNGASVILSLLLSLVTVSWLGSLDFALVSIVFLLSFRCFLSDLYLQKQMHMTYTREVLHDVLVALVFILGNRFVGGIFGWTLYCLFVLGFCLVRRKTYKKAYDTLMEFVH
jgi:O-antigen/teichoic acid export membrane protein